MSPLLRSGLACTQEAMCSHAPSNGSLCVRRQPRTRFLFSCCWYKVGSPLDGSEIPFLAGTTPVVHFPPQRREEAIQRQRTQRDSPRRHSGTVPVAGVARVPT